MNIFIILTGNGFTEAHICQNLNCTLKYAQFTISQLSPNKPDKNKPQLWFIPVNPKGNKSGIFIGRTGAESEAPMLWPPDVKNGLTGKDPDAGKD